MTTKERYERTRAELDEICRKCGRAPEEVTLVAVRSEEHTSELQSRI